MIYNMQMVPQIVFGAGALEKLSALIPADARVLIVSGGSSQRNGTVERITGFLVPRKVAVYSSVKPEPTIQQVDEVRAMFRDFQASAVVAVGGGSALDTGKVVAAAADSQIPTAEYFFNRALLPEKGCFMAALPTTAGTGAEVTPNGVFSDEITGIKQSIRGGTILPSLALVDPELSISCPANVTAASGLDALTQGIESYIARKANNTTQALAMQGVRLINNAIEAVYGDGGNIYARSDMSEGTMLGAMAFAVSGLGAVHGLAHPLGAKLHLPHGLVCGILLPQILKWNYPVCREELNDLACFAGLPCAEALIERTGELLEKFERKRNLSVYGLKADDFPWIVANSRSGSMRANPRDFSDEELNAILYELL